MADDDGMVDFSQAELAAIREERARDFGPGGIHRVIEVPTARGWSTPTFACHRQVSSCVLACCCPCVLFGFNQRTAFRASCVLWTLLWLAPLAVVWFLVARHLGQVSSVQLEQDLVALSESLPLAEKPYTLAWWFAVPLGLACAGLVGAARRGKLRAKYGIAGSWYADFACHACCLCCSLAKEAREIRWQALEETIAGAQQDLAADEV